MNKQITPTSALIICAYRPAEEILQLVDQALRSSFQMIIVVDDGSGERFSELFEKISQNTKVKLITHLENEGKGAALKTAYRHLSKSNSIENVVCMDSDGQHLLADSERLLALSRCHPDSVLLGVRKFDRAVPFRNLIGNLLCIQLFRILFKRKFSDTQTGLRLIPTKLLSDLCKISANGFDFETVCLIFFLKKNIPIVELPITTIYKQKNAISYFRPLKDSIKVSFATISKIH